MHLHLLHTVPHKQITNKRQGKPRSWRYLKIVGIDYIKSFACIKGWHYFYRWRRKKEWHWTPSLWVQVRCSGQKFVFPFFFACVDRLITVNPSRKQLKTDGPLWRELETNLLTKPVHKVKVVELQQLKSSCKDWWWRSQHISLWDCPVKKSAYFSKNIFLRTLLRQDVRKIGQ